MSAINRNVLRAVYNATEVTSKIQSIQSSTLAFVFDNSEFFYLGYQRPFASRFVSMGTVNTNSAALTVKYFDGTQYSLVEDLVDQTSAMTSSGFISWENPGNWQKTTVSPITDVELYWIQIATSADFSAGTTIQAIMNLFCDDTLLNAYYPELQSDSRFKPVDTSGNALTNFHNQYSAAKDLVVHRLKQRKAIIEEAQIVDINEVAVAAVHASAYLILNPIAASDEAKEMRDTAKDNFENEINQIQMALDLNRDGKIDDAERESVGTVDVVRR